MNGALLTARKHQSCDRLNGLNYVGFFNNAKLNIYQKSAYMRQPDQVVQHALWHTGATILMASTGDIGRGETSTICELN